MAANDPALTRLLAVWSGLSAADRNRLADLAAEQSQSPTLTTGEIRRRLIHRLFS